MNTTTVVFTFSSEYAANADIIDYYTDVIDDDEDVLLYVYVNDVASETLFLSDEDLCEFFGLDSEFLLWVNRDY